jgi:hypothetical protein
MIPLLWNTKNRQIHRQKVGQRLPGAGGNEELLLNGYKFLFEVMKIFGKLVMVVQHCEYNLMSWTVHLKMGIVANFMLCKFYHNF